MTEYTEDEKRMFCAWADYCKEYGLSSERITSGHPQFIAGWQAARDNHATLNWGYNSMDWKAGFEAFHGTLDIDSEMR